MNTLLWLDDKRNPFIDKSRLPEENYDRIVWVRSFQEFFEYINFNKFPDGISFDHDLKDSHYVPDFFWDDYVLSFKYQLFELYKRTADNRNNETGLDVASTLIVTYENELKAKGVKIYIHSANPVGSDWIRDVFEEAGIPVKNQITGKFDYEKT